MQKEVNKLQVFVAEGFHFDVTIENSVRKIACEKLITLQS